MKSFLALVLLSIPISSYAIDENSMCEIEFYIIHTSEVTSTCVKEFKDFDKIEFGKFYYFEQPDGNTIAINSNMIIRAVHYKAAQKCMEHGRLKPFIKKLLE